MRCTGVEGFVIPFQTNVTPQDTKRMKKTTVQIAPPLAITESPVRWVSVQASFSKGYMSHRKLSMTLGP